jgi:uncharacterized repeat protein (TIGR03803 family)
MPLLTELGMWILFCDYKYAAPTVLPFGELVIFSNTFDHTRSLDAWDLELVRRSISFYTPVYTRQQSMKRAKHFLMAAFILPALASSAQVYNILHSFGSQSRDGYGPATDLVLAGNTLYGATLSGGTNGNGTIFKINTDGSGYQILLSLTNGPIEGGMVLIGDTLYSTTYTGGANDNGSIFKIDTNGSGYAELHSFEATVPSAFGTNSDGNRPQGDLVTDGNTLYGTAQLGGPSGNGTIFKINTDGSGFTVIKAFSPTFLGTNNVSGNPIVTSGTNLDGARSVGSLVLDGGTLYGTTYKGGVSNGVVFSVETNGDNYTVLKYFPGITGPPNAGTNTDGAAPIAGLTLNGDTLYGTTVGGGAESLGVVFTLKTNGTGFANLHDFLVADGAFPRNSLLLDGATLYGTTAAGGITNRGTIFMLQTNGADFIVLRNFDNTSGSQCDAKFVLSSNILYATAVNGGSNSSGVVFGLTVLPHIMIDTNLGIRFGSFGFDYNGISNQTAIIDSTTNLSQPVWIPLQTNLLIGVPLHFGDLNAPQNSSTFYRIRSP